MAGNNPTSATAEKTIQYLDGLPILSSHPLPRVVCWIITGYVKGQPQYWLFDPEQPASIREAGNL